MTIAQDREAFDRVARHLLTQKARANQIAGEPACCYRARDGKRCAIGCLIADEHYREDLEGCALLPSSDEAHPVIEALRRSGVQADIRLLARLQTIHDRKPVNQWRKHLRRLRDEWFAKKKRSKTA